MEKSLSEKLLLNLISEKYDTFKADFISILNYLTENKQEDKYHSIKKLYNSANSMADILSTKDRPYWLNRTISLTNSYLSSHTAPNVVVSGANWQLSQEAWKIHNSVINHSWNFNSTNNEDFNFDEIYKKYRDNSKLSELFDSLINIINKMIDSGEIDSLKAISALNELTATLSQNKNSSYFSTMTSWNFLKSFTKNYVWEQVSSISAIKNLKTAFEKTLVEMDIELDDLHKNIKEEMQQKYKLTVQSALTYTKSDTKLLESKSND